MQALIEYLAKEGQVILHAPVTFGVALVLLVGLAWAALSWAYSARLDSSESRNKLKDDQLADYKNKLSGASPDEAKARLDALERQVFALAPRRLLEEERAKLRSALAGANGMIEIAQDVGAGEIKHLARDFALLFQEEGWIVSPSSVMGVGMPPRTGIALKVVNPASLSPLESRLKRALEEAGIEYDLQPGLRRSPPHPPSPPGFPTPPRDPDPDVGLLFSSRLS